jgi:hypothetical protein
MLKKINLRDLILYVVFIAALVILGTMCYKYYTIIEQLEQEKIDLLDETMKKNESIIDSLENKISQRESVIDSLSLVRKEIIIEKKVVIDEVRELPLTDAVEFLRKSLKDYEESFEVYYMSDSITTP